MKQLVLKDIRLLGLLNIILLVAGMFIGGSAALYGETDQSNLTYGAASFIGVYIILINLSNQDIKFKAAPFMLSLPVKRFDLVKARYVAVFIYILSILGVFVLSSGAVSIFLQSRASYFKLHYILLTMSLILIFAAINIPFQYFDQQKAQIFNVILYALVLLSPRIYEKLGLDFLNTDLLEKLAWLNILLFSFIVFCVSLSLYMVSMFVSKFIYKRKEF